MKFLLNNLVYDTEKASKLAETGALESNALYKTPAGRFFQVQKSSLAGTEPWAKALSAEEGRALFVELASRGGACVPIKDVIPGATDA